MMVTPTRDDYQDLPEPMLKARRWLVHKSKRPFYANGKPRSGILDSPTDIADFASFDDALKALQNGQFDGLGFALGPDGSGNYWQGIDIDDLPNRSELQHLADNLPGYTEQSPSGRGMHAIGFGKAFETLGANETGIEAYSSGRYFTVTAACAGLHPICDISGFVASQLCEVHRLGRAQLQTTDNVNVETVDVKTVTELRSALHFLRSDDRDLWIQVGHSLKTIGEVGRGLWIDWSSTSDKFDPADASRTWDSFKPKSTSYKAVFSQAQSRGWVNPLSNAASISVSAPVLGPNNFPYARAEPVVDLDSCVVNLDESINPDSEHPHAIEKLVPLGEVTLIAGHGAAGKSYIALLICILVALGRDFDMLPTKASRVLFFSAEDDKAELQRRVARICRTLGVEQTVLKDQLYLMDVSEIDPTLYRVDSRGLALEMPMLDSLASFVGNHDIGLTVVDNASDVFDGNENVRNQVRAFMRILRQRLARPSRSVILLAHISKVAAYNRRASKGMATDEDYSGSTAWHNSSRSRLSLDTDGNGISTIKHMKANKGPKVLKEIQLEWHAGCPTIAGTFQTPGAELADSFRRSSMKAQDEANKVTLVEIVSEFDSRGERVPVSPSGPHSTFRKLKTVPEFPNGLDSDRCATLMRELEREGRIFRVTKRTPDRKHVECFSCLSGVDESAPLQPAPLVVSANQKKDIPR